MNTVIGCCRRLRLNQNRFAAALALLLLCMGCTNTGARARLGLRLAPETFGSTISLQQRITIQRADVAEEMDAALEIDSDRIDLIGLVFGRRVLSLHYDGNDLQTWLDASMPPIVRGEDVLEDLQLTFWPLDVLITALPVGWRIEDAESRRMLLLENLPVMVIHYSGAPRWEGTTQLVNLRYGYSLNIQSVPAGATP